MNCRFLHQTTVLAHSIVVIIPRVVLGCWSLLGDFRAGLEYLIWCTWRIVEKLVNEQELRINYSGRSFRTQEEVPVKWILKSKVNKFKSLLKLLLKFQEFKPMGKQKCFKYIFTYLGSKPSPSMQSRSWFQSKNLQIANTLICSTFICCLLTVNVSLLYFANTYVAKLCELNTFAFITSASFREYESKPDGILSNT